MIDGATLKELRIRVGYTQVQLSAVTGIPASVLSAYERGRRQPRLDAAMRVIRALGFNVVLVPTTPIAVNAARLEEALELAATLPYTPRPQAKARRSDDG